MIVIRYLVLCFADGEFYRIGMSDDPNEATDMMKRDVLHELEYAGYKEDDEDYIGIESGHYYSDLVNIDATTAHFSDADMYWTIMQIDIEV